MGRSAHRPHSRRLTGTAPRSQTGHAEGDGVPAALGTATLLGNAAMSLAQRERSRGGSGLRLLGLARLLQPQVFEPTLVPTPSRGPTLENRYDLPRPVQLRFARRLARSRRSSGASTGSQ